MSVAMRDVRGRAHPESCKERHQQALRSLLVVATSAIRSARRRDDKQLLTSTNGKTLTVVPSSRSAACPLEPASEASLLEERRGLIPMTHRATRRCVKGINSGGADELFMRCEIATFQHFSATFATFCYFSAAFAGPPRQAPLNLTVFTVIYGYFLEKSPPGSLVNLISRHYGQNGHNADLWMPKS